MMRATQLEFQGRFWIIGAIYFVGFYCFRFDVSLIDALRHVLAPSLIPDSTQAKAFNQTVIGCGALLVVVAAFFRTWAAAYLRTEVVHDSSHHAEALIADGPFRYVRNPLYLATLPIAAGVGVLASRLGWAFLVVANLVFVYRLILSEEQTLSQRQGESYRAYIRAVPRFWPSLTRRVAASGRPPKWRQAFVGESFIWLVAIAQLFFALTLNARLAAYVLLLGFIVHFAIVRRIRRSNGRD